MRKLTLSILAAALVVASAPAFADQPNGSVIVKTNNGNGSNGNVCVGDHPERPIR
jgi:hypothetical protein